MRLPIVSIEGGAPFLWVSCWLREGGAVGVLIVQDVDGVAVEHGYDQA